MSSGGGSDPTEVESKLLAVTESLVGANIAPSIHLGRGITISAATRRTHVMAEIEAEDGEDAYVFEIAKEELWRAVVLIDEYGLGPNVPSAIDSRESSKHRRKLADMFLTNELADVGRGSSSSGGVTVARVSVSSLSPAAALTALTVLSGTPATTESRSGVVVSGDSVASPSPRISTKKVPTPAARDVDRDGDAPGVLDTVASGPAAPNAISEAERLRQRQYERSAQVAREVASMRAAVARIRRKWRDLARVMHTVASRAAALDQFITRDKGPVAPAPAPRGPAQLAKARAATKPRPLVGDDLATCMARGTAGRGRTARASPAAADVIEILEDLSGESDVEEDGEDGDVLDASDESVKSEQFDDDQTVALLRELRAAAGGGGDARDAPRARQDDDPVELLDAFVPRQLTEKATHTIIKFMIGHVRETLEATGAKLAPTDERADVRKDMHQAGLLLVRLAGFVSQSPGELVRATVVRAGTPRPCKTALQGATALKALREIVLEHSTARGSGARGAAQSDVDQGTTGRKSSLSSSGVLRQQLGLQNARFQMFHVADGGSDKVGSEVLGQNIFERGLRSITNDPAARAQLLKVYELLEEGLSVTDSGDDPFMATPGCLFVRTVAGLVGTAHSGGSGGSMHTSTMWAHVFLAEECGKPSASTRERMMHDEGYDFLDTVWQTVSSVRAGIEQVLQQEWRRLMRRESLDATELAKACWFGRWRKFDLKKAITAEQTSSWLGAVKGDSQSLSSVWAIFTSFFLALTYVMTTLTHHWDSSVSFTLQLISSSAVSALEANVPATQIIEMLPSVVFARFDDAHREFRQLGRALPSLAQTWAGFSRSEAHQRFREVVMLRSRGKEEAGSSSELYKALKALEQKFEESQGGGGKGAGGKAKSANFVPKQAVDRFIAEHPGMCWVHHLKGNCTKKECPHTHGPKIAFDVTQ